MEKKKWKARLDIYATTVVEATDKEEAINLALMDMDNNLITIKEFNVKVEELV